MTVYVVVAFDGESAWVEGVGKTKRAAQVIVSEARENAKDDARPAVILPPVECEVRYA